MTASTDVALPRAQPTAASRVWPARVFVGGVWLVLTLGLLAYVFHYGSNVPFFDDWHLVPYITGDKPVTPEYLWSQHGDHRVPLSRLLLLGLGKLCGYDFRCGMVFDVLALSGTSLVLIAVSRHLRGRLAFADAFFPLLLLNPGQWEVYLWCWIASLTLPITLALIVLAIMAKSGVRPSWPATLTVGLLVLALPLTDSAGLAFVPALILWLVTVGVCRLRRSESRQAAISLAFAVAAVALVAVYYLGYTRLQGGEEKPGIAAALRTTIEFLSMGIGHASVLIWPLSALIVLAFLVSAVYVLGRIWLDQPDDRSRVAALAFFLLGALSLALALGWGRGGEGSSAGFKSRYVVLSLPVPAAVFLIWGCYRGRWRNVVQAAMCLVMFLLLPLNVKTALDGAHLFHPGLAAFENDLRDGKPPSLLAEQYTNVVFPWPVDAPDKQLVHDRLLMLQRAGVGPYRDMAPDVTFHEMLVTLRPEEFNGAHAPVLLEEPQRVLAIRVRYTFADHVTRTPGLKVFWKKPGGDESVRAEVSSVPPIFGLPAPQEQTAIAYVNERIDQLRVLAYDARPVLVQEIVLFVKDE
jgi:hypothetical protein